MEKISLWRKLSLFLSYRKIVMDNEVDMGTNVGLKLDWVNRMYTVLNIPEEFFDEPYNLRKGDIDKIAENYIKEYINTVNLYFQSKGLNELVTFVKPISKVDKYSYLIVFGFSQMENTTIYRNTILLSVLTTIVSLTTFLILHH